MMWLNLNICLRAGQTTADLGLEANDKCNFLRFRGLGMYRVRTIFATLNPLAEN